MTGWRLNGLEPSGRLTGFDFGVGESTQPAECVRLSVPGFRSREYLHSMRKLGRATDDWGTRAHPAPAENCVCGWCLSTTLYPLWMISAGEHIAPALPGAVPIPVYGPLSRLDNRPLLINCEGLGLEYVDAEDVTRESFRYSRLRFTGLALVREDTDPELVKQFRLWYPGALRGTFTVNSGGIQADWGSNPVPDEYRRAEEAARFDRPFPYQFGILPF